MNTSPQSFESERSRRTLIWSRSNRLFNENLSRRARDDERRHAVSKIYIETESGTATDKHYTLKALSFIILIFLVRYSVFKRLTLRLVLSSYCLP